MSKIMCPTCHKHLARMNPLYGPTACKWCLKKSVGESPENRTSFHISKAPEKGSPEWYKGKWFRRSEKEWHEDIRSRVASPDGKRVIRNG